ncbi:MAG TPA: PASTA domain-containing protein [Thermoanaerobaculia bacterium]|nr:PASTA domain-containing protein [Thermoanaerobaculia bacterium]
MRKGCINNVVFLVLLALGFGVSSYFWFKFFVRGRSIGTPALVGRSFPDARALSSDSGLVLDEDRSKDRHSDTVLPGAIVWQNQRPGTLVKRGTRIIVGRSLGPLILRVPNLEGESPRTALLRFNQLNLRLGYVANMPRSGKPGIVAADPPEGVVVKAQRPISLLAAIEPPPRRWVMPDLIEREVDPVRASLEVRGLRVAQVRYEPYPGLPDGRIIRQYPAAGAPVSAKDAISLVVSRQEQVGFELP